jgi:hypothetical protein
MLVLRHENILSKTKRNPLIPDYHSVLIPIEVPE